MTPTKFYRRNPDDVTIKEVAVLISPGYGSGWSTDNDNDELENFLLFDKTLVDAKLVGHNQEWMQSFLDKLFEGEDAPFANGWDQVVIEWIPVGTQFMINCYDGHEYIVVYNPAHYITA